MANITSSTGSSSDESLLQQLREQWSNPGDILSVLLIVGSDVIQKALAQFNGQPFKPVAFSFGWVAYAYAFLFQAVGRLKSMPEPDFPSLLINCKTGRQWDKSSWLFGRILRHYNKWKPEAVKYAEKERQMELQARRGGEMPANIPGLSVTVFLASNNAPQGVPVFDRVTWTGIFVAIIQLGIAAIPCGLYRDWEVLMLTACGTLLAWLMGFLQESSSNVRKKTKKTFALTSGPGTRDVIVILGNEAGLDLEDMATEVAPVERSYTVAFASILVVLWTSLLITTSGMKSHTWYLLAIGGIGMIQNIYVAGATRLPSAYGIHLEFHECISNVRVMKALMSAEEKYPEVGRSLLPVLFPGPLTSEEAAWWAAREAESKYM